MRLNRLLQRGLDGPGIYTVVSVTIARRSAAIIGIIGIFLCDAQFT